MSFSSVCHRVVCYYHWILNTGKLCVHLTWWRRTHEASSLLHRLSARHRKGHGEGSTASGLFVGCVKLRHSTKCVKSLEIAAIVNVYVDSRINECITLKGLLVVTDPQNYGRSLHLFAEIWYLLAYCFGFVHWLYSFSSLITISPVGISRYSRQRAALII